MSTSRPLRGERFEQRVRADHLAVDQHAVAVEDDQIVHHGIVPIPTGGPIPGEA